MRRFGQPTSQTDQSVSGRRARFVLGFAFLLTGMGTALLGAALPALLAEWHLSDRTGGSLLFSAFAGSTLGALLVRRALHVLAGVGLAISAAAIGYLSQARGGFFSPAFFLYGIGLGVTMTAISILWAREALPSRSLLEMNRLNLLWASGACLAPAFATRSLHVISVTRLFGGAAVAFALTAAATFLVSGRRSPELSRAEESGAGELQAEGLHPGGLQPDAKQPLVPARLWIFAAAAVALETALGSWLTTYAERVTHQTGMAVWANSAFWMGLLLSRAAHSAAAAWRPHFRAGLLWHLSAVAVSTAFLIASPRGTALPLAAFCAGAGLGPLYPLALSLALPHYRSGAVFVACGIGAAFLPWITGALSTAAQSLRAGLLAPCATVVILLVAGSSVRRRIPEHI